MTMFQNSIKNYRVVIGYVMSLGSLAVSVVCVRKLYRFYSETYMSNYRDKSALFGRELKPGEPPSWPVY